MMTRQGWRTALLQFFVLAFAALGMTGVAQAQRPAFKPEINIIPTLHAESQAPAAGTTVMLAIAMEPKPGWHGYWINGGDAGITPRFDWSLPAGVTAGAARYPVPERLILFDLMNHVYEGPHAFLVPVTLPKNAALGSLVPIKLKAFYLACTDKICLPQDAELSIDLKVGNGAITQADRAKFDAWRAHLPRPIGADGVFETDAKSVRIAIPYPAGLSAQDLWYFAADDNLTSYNKPQKIARRGDTLYVELARNGDQIPQRLNGLLAIGKDQGFAISAVPGRVSPLTNALIIPADPKVAKQTSQDGTSTDGTAAMALLPFLYAFAGALIGGLLLNIMPCVFPVISLKAISLARAGGDERSVRSEAVFYSAGTILTCTALGAMLLILRSGGAAIGWAFQLQDPRVILFLLVLVCAITLNLLGVLHLRGTSMGDGLTRAGGRTGAFWTGALAAFVATPCTGPFMAAALGAALVLPAWAALAIFAGLGLGLAAPFLALGYWPALRSRLPRPGPWMVTFQRWMAVPMALTALALAWLLWRQSGPAGLLWGLGATVVTGLALFLWGRQKNMRFSRLFLAGASVSAIILAAVSLPQGSESKVGMTGAIPFSEASLAKLRGEGKPVFLYFTADWCVTCKINETAAIDRTEVIEAFEAKGVTVMVGDWTAPDPAISRFLESQGRSGIPLYLVYRTGTKTPVILPQLLTPAMLTGAF
jgi:thiol:disulfide interchange protein/DsbC/DsbD-like thiol-disulfide interchange protein